MENRLDEILNTLKSNVITHKAKYLEIRYDLIEEVIKNNDMAFLDEKERLEYVIDSHYSCPFENINDVFKYYKEIYKHLEDDLIKCEEKYELTNEELDLIKMMCAENLFIPIHKFILMAIKVDFKVFDEEGNLINDDIYMEGTDF